MQEVVWNEAGEARRLKGKIIAEDKEFLTIETEYKIFKINKAIVIKIEQIKENGKEMIE